MTQKEIKHIFSVEPDGSIEPRTLTTGSAVSEIPPGVYSLCVDEKRVYLRPENAFKLPSRIYGNVNKNVDRFIRSYEMNDKNLGVLLIGESGSGKTLTLKALAAKAVLMGFPVILVNEQLPSNVLTYFLSTITQPTLVCLDEYDKTHGMKENGDTSDQRDILQLLDGTNSGNKKMFVLTANDA